MSENKQKLHAMIDSITDGGIAEYLETFIRLFLENGGMRHEKHQIIKF